MVKVSYGRYSDGSREYHDTLVWDPDRKRNVFACRQCGGPSHHPFHYYCSRPHKERWEKENSPPVWAYVRREILKRDAYTCQICGVAREQLRAALHEAMLKPGCRWIDYELEVDHIQPVKTHPELEFDRANLRVLCHPCHVRHGARPQARGGGPDPLVNVRPLEDFA